MCVECAPGVKYLLTKWWLYYLQRDRTEGAPLCTSNVEAVGFAGLMESLCVQREDIPLHKAVVLGRVRCVSRM